jgi:predicted nucleotide-binding protein (sugar kinase/HSP70/actin superfamily)
MPVRVGIPRYLAYFAYYPWWKTFFEELGLDVVTSAPTTQKTLDAGVAETVNDACIPIKLYHGHVAELRDIVDIIFVPRLVTVRKFGTETFCPKFLGLPDLLRASMSGLPELLDTRVDLAKGRFELFRISQEIGEKFGAGFSTIVRAYWRANLVFRRYLRLLYKGMFPEEAMECLEKGSKPALKKNKEALTLALLGYPYTVYDRFANLDLVKRLQRLGVRVVTADMVPSRLLLRKAKYMPKQMFWHFSNRAMHATYYYLNRKIVDGIIHITAFACGPDAMLDRAMEFATRERGQMPFMTVSIDEETGTGGIQTRLEAFVDMLKRRRGLE